MSTATDMLAAYLAAEVAILKGQTVKFGERTLTMANLPEIQKGRFEWEQRVNNETAAAARPFGQTGPLSSWGAKFPGAWPGGYQGDGWSPIE